jgi:DNA-binding NarL/FixJ family response regulator
MNPAPKLVLVSRDIGLIAHWQGAFKKKSASTLSDFSSLLALNAKTVAVVWIDLALPDLPEWSQSDWASLLLKPGLKVVAASSNPKDGEAIQALDAGCVGYCHAYSDPATLVQVKQVVEAGQIWIGRTLMQRLIQSARKVKPSSSTESADSWSAPLSPREKEVAILAANGASNLNISRECKISERTVKAHLSAVFEKLNLSDRLQLALRVHGIH